MSFRFFRTKRVAIMIASGVVVLGMLLGNRGLMTGEAPVVPVSGSLPAAAVVLEVEEKKRFVIDRIEQAYAVCEGEDGHMFQCSLMELPVDLNEGDVICRINGKMQKDLKETVNSKRKIQDEANALWD